VRRITFYLPRRPPSGREGKNTAKKSHDSHRDVRKQNQNHECAFHGKEEVLARIGDVIATFLHVHIAYVYGSFLEREDFRDIDVGLFVDRTLSPADRDVLAGDVGIALERAFAFSFPFDVRVLDDTPVWFQYEVIARGRPVFSRDEGERYERETDILTMYLDMKYTYDIFDSGYLARA